MALYSEIGRKALQFFYENEKMITALAGTPAIIYYEEYEDEDGYGEFHFWNFTDLEEEDFSKQNYSIYIELKDIEKPSLYQLMDRFFDHVSL